MTTILGKHQESITLYLDFTCPWSYIGWRNLMQALREMPERYPQPLLIYRSHELNSSIVVGAPFLFQEYMLHRFGDEASISDWQNIIFQAGIDSGIMIDFSKIQYIFNTRLLHYMMKALQMKLHQQSSNFQGKLSESSQFEDLQNFIERAFHASILQGKQLDNPQMIFAETGFDCEQLLKGHSRSYWQQELDNDLFYSRKAGMTGIPCYSFGAHYSLFGAQGVKGYGAMLDLLYETAKNLQQDNRLGTLFSSQFHYA